MAPLWGLLGILEEGDTGNPGAEWSLLVVGNLSADHAWRHD